MSFAAYDMAELEKDKGYRCLWCLVISSKLVSRVDLQESRRDSLHIYESEAQRARALAYWRRTYMLAETVFFLFEIPVDFYLEKAEKQI